MTDLTGFERSVLSWLDFEGTMRLVEIVAMANPRPTSIRALLFGGPAIEEWKSRTGKLCEAMWALEDKGLAECVRPRRLRMSSVYGITEAGRMAFAAINEAAREKS